MKNILATLLASAALGLSLAACGESEPVVGVVVEKEYEPAVWDHRQDPVYTQICGLKKVGGVYQQSCQRVRTGTRKVDVLIRAECYEFDLDTGWEGCVSRDAWNALDVEDTYDSTKRY